LHHYAASGNYTVQLIVTSDNGCSDTAAQQITVLPVPEPAFLSALACEKTPSTLTDNSFISSGTIVNWVYDFGGGNTLTGPDVSYVFPGEGVYQVTLTATSALGCEADTTMPVTVLNSPVADFSANPNPALILENIYFTDLSTGSPLSTWYWNFGDGEGDNSQNTVHNYGQDGDYTVTLTVTDIYGCQDTATRVISLALLPVLPTGFTPTGDGENDVFVIRGGPFEAVDFRIYNNWGQEIFATTEIDAGWDGTYKDEPAPPGVYTWTFVVQIADGKVIKKSGDVTLIR
jgi:gliding motility-associated-like protein